MKAHIFKWAIAIKRSNMGRRRAESATVLSFLRGPFERAGCSCERDGWITTDPHTGEKLKWKPSEKRTLRWNSAEGRWVQSNKSREEFLLLARLYQNTRKRRS